MPDFKIDATQTQITTLTRRVGVVRPASSFLAKRWDSVMTVHRFEASTVLLAEDTTGHGHTILIGDREPMM